MEKWMLDQLDKFLVPTGENIWSGRTTDPALKFYWYQHVERIPSPELIQKGDFVIIGYESDEGIQRNQGRVGASAGPAMIRRMLGRIAWHHGKQRVTDIGNIIIPNGQMEESQFFFSKLVYYVLNRGAIPICLGGGHDIAFGTGSGYLDFLKDKNGKEGGIINFDAHFDLREDVMGANSGTPFYQLAQKCKSDALKFKYLVLGIQAASNTTDLFELARELDVKYILDEALTQNNQKETMIEIQSFLEEVDDVYLSVDMDAFSGAFAPGVSALNPIGIDPKCFFNTYSDILRTRKVKILEIAETNPLYDRDDLTSRLAARIVDEFIRNSGI